MTEPQPLPDADLLAWSVVLEYRVQQQRDGITILLLPFPPCPTCGQTVLSVEVSRAFQRDLDSQWIIMQPCQHTYDVTDGDIQRIHGHAGDMLEAMKATDNSRAPGTRAWTTAEVIRQAQVRVGEPDPEAPTRTWQGYYAPSGPPCIPDHGVPVRCPGCEHGAEAP